MMPNGEPIDDRIPDRRADASSRTIMPYIKNLAHARHRRDACASSIRCSTARASTISISTSRSSASSFSSTPGDSLRTYFSLAGGRATKGSQNLAGIADPAIDALIDADHRRQDAAGTDHRLPRARPRRSAPGATGFRTGTRRRTGSPIGTCSAARRRKPRYFRGIPETWWYDRDKAAKVENRRARPVPAAAALLHAARADAHCRRTAGMT